MDMSIVSSFIEYSSRQSNTPALQMTNWTTYEYEKHTDPVCRYSRAFPVGLLIRNAGLGGRNP